MRNALFVVLGLLAVLGMAVGFNGWSEYPPPIGEIMGLLAILVLAVVAGAVLVAASVRKG